MPSKTNVNGIVAIRFDRPWANPVAEQKLITAKITTGIFGRSLRFILGASKSKNPCSEQADNGDQLGPLLGSGAEL